MGKTEEHEGKKYLIVDDYMRDKLLGKIKEIIGIQKFMILRFSLIQMINCQMILLLKMF